MTLRFAYNTNGTAHHRLEDALGLIAGAGYDGVALTLDVHHLDPFAPGHAREAEALARRLEALGLGCVIETGARFLLDPLAKHEPTLVTADAAGRLKRVEFLKRAVDAAAVLGAEAVSFWAGVPRPGVEPALARAWLREGLEVVLAHAARAGVTAALEPEPGMLVETVDDYAALAADFPSLTLALDLGHLLVTGEREPPAAIHEFAGALGTVTIEDMKRGVHVHLPFGEGDFELPPALAALEAVAFPKLVCVELSRESHRADVMVPAALAALRAALPGAAPREGTCV